MNRGIKFLTLQDYINDDLKSFGDWFGWDKQILSSHNYKIYNDDEYDLVPKPHHIQRRIKELERQLESKKQIFEMQKKTHEGQVKTLEVEIEQLKQKIK